MTEIKMLKTQKWQEWKTFEAMNRNVM